MLKSRIKKKYLSIITATKDEPEAVEKTISSLRKDVEDLFEYILVDASEGFETAKKIGKNSAVIYIHERDNGIYDGMNKGAQMSSGHYLMFLNSGDEFTNFNGILKAAISAHEDGYKIVLFDTYFAWNDGNTGKNKVNLHSKFDMPCSHQGMLIERGLFLGLKYDYRFKVSADYMLYKQALEKINLNEILVLNDLFLKTAPPGFTARNGLLHLRELFRINLLFNGFFNASIYLLRGYLLYLIKFLFNLIIPKKIKFQIRKFRSMSH